jgi:TonB family protein
MSLAHYLLQVNIYLVIFYCFYKILLSSETYFVLNRIYLLAAGVFSLCIPFLRFEWFSKQEVAKPIYVGVDQFSSFVTQVKILEDNAPTFNWANLFVTLYLLGILYFTIRLIWQLLAIRKLFKNVANGTAFSFLRKKIIADSIPELPTVSAHEDIHVKQLHTIDVLFFEIIGIFAWFNPVVYLYKKTIKNIHEYLADEAAAKFQGDKEAYSLLLLSQAFGVKTHTLTNSFFSKSLIKKRILMLHKERSKKTAILKYGLFVPLFALTLILSAATIRKNKQILAVANIIPLGQVKDVVTQAIDHPLSIVNLAAFPPPVAKEEYTLSEDVDFGDVVASENRDVENTEAINGFYRYLSERIKYPNNAIAKKLQGNSVINFKVRHGKISDATVQNQLGEGCDEEIISEILAYNDFFQKDGNYSLVVRFKLEGLESDFKNEAVNIPENHTALQRIEVLGLAPKEENSDAVYTFVNIAKPPTYPGGAEKFYEFLAKNIKYPTAAVDNEIQGNVHVSFTVEKDGSLTDLKVERKLGFGIDEEAIRVIKLAKKWNPGMQNGKAVRVKYNIPVKFSLDTKSPDKKANAMASVRFKNYAEKDAPMIIVDNQIKDQAYLNGLDGKNIESINVFSGTDAVSVYGKAAEKGAIVIRSKSNKSNVVSATLTNKN